MRSIRVAAAVAIAAAAVAFWGAPADAKSFEIAAVHIEAALQGDGSMDIVEHITYDFDGSFSTGTRPIPDGELYDIVDVRVTEDGQPLPTAGAPYDLSWRFSAEDERRTFDIAYRVVGAAVVGSDVAELYWKWVGDQHPGVGQVRVVLQLPGGGEGARVWGHGPLDGKVFRDGSRAFWTVDGLPEGQFLEGRIAVPVGLMTVTPGAEPRLDRIIAEETELADEANRIREARERRTRLFNQWFWLVPLAGWGIYVLIWRRWGREFHPGDLEYVREPPDDPPAVVCALLAWGAVPSLAFSATLVDLAQRGHLEIIEELEDRWILPDKREWRFRRTGPGDDLRDWEERILDRLFASGSEVSQDEFVKWGKEHPETAKKFWNRFVADVKREVKARRYFERGRVAPYLLNIGTATVVIALGIAAIANEAWIGIVGIVSGTAQEIATIALRRRTREGAQRAEEWLAFKRFLTDFSQLDDAPVGHMELYERYLVYSVALAVSDEVANGLAMRVPQPAGAGDRSGFAPWYHPVAAGSGVRNFGAIGAFAAFGSTVQSSFVPSSSSGSGGGGGFSGGGGGGGGGGGIGAS